MAAASNGIAEVTSVRGTRGIPKDERTPLLPTDAEEIDPMVLGHGAENASISSSIYNLSTTIIGAGIMGLPSKMKVLGLPFGLLFLMAMGALSEYSIQVMLRCSNISKVWSYADLMTEAYGKVGRGFTRFFVIINNIGILIIYLIIISDVLSGTGNGTSHHPGLFEELAGGSFWWNTRGAVMGMTIILLCPLVALQHVDSLHWSSALSILLAIVFVIITVVVASFRLLKGSIDFEDIRWTPKLSTWDDILDLFTVIPTVATAYVCHYNVHPIYVELKPPRQENMSIVAKASLLLCTIVYMLTAFFGYLLFGEATEGDILANFDVDLGVPGSKVLNMIIRLSYAVHLMLVFPVIHFSLRGNMDSVLFPHASPLIENRWRFVGVTAGLMAVILFGATSIPNIDLAFHLTGSVAAVSLAFTLPGLAALSVKTGLSSKEERSLAWAMVFLGISCTITGLGSKLYALLL